jgi:hypothetical protein
MDLDNICDLLRYRVLPVLHDEEDERLDLRDDVLMAIEHLNSTEYHAC